MTNFVRRSSGSDDRERLTCLDCGHVFYENPKLVVGAVVSDAEGRVLLCRRAIEPRRGFWTLPAGYLELGETLAEGAAREAAEEARATIEIEGVLAIYDIARIGQVQVIHRARLAATGEGPAIACGEESLEVAMFDFDEIPWDAIAFPTVRWALDAWRAGRADPLALPDRNPPSDPRGVVPPGRGAETSEAVT